MKEGADKIMKKKIMTALMCAALALSAGNTVLAAETVTGDGSSASTDVTGTYQASTPSTVYSVALTWGSMAFTYQDKEREWDVSSHQYVDKAGSEDYWACEKDANKVTVENRSNAAVDAKLSFTQESGTDYTGTFYAGEVTASNNVTGAAELTDNTLSLADRSTGSPAETEYKKSAWLMMNGGTLASGDSGKKLGTVTVTINAAASQNP